MELSLGFAFSKPATKQRVLSGSYSNIRLFMYGAESLFQVGLQRHALH